MASGLCKTACSADTGRWEMTIHSILMLPFTEHLPTECNVLCWQLEGYTQAKALPQGVYNLGGNITACR